VYILGQEYWRQRQTFLQIRRRLMEAVKGYYDGTNFIPVNPVSVKKNQKVIITMLDENDSGSMFETASGIDGLYALLDEAEQDIKTGRIAAFPEAIDDIIAKYE
jgi:hypothetical protein